MPFDLPSRAINLAKIDKFVKFVKSRDERLAALDRVNLNPFFAAISGPIAKVLTLHRD